MFFVLLIGVAVAESASAKNPLLGGQPVLVADATWETVAGGGPPEYFPTPDEACRRQHQVYNPNATYQTPEFRGPDIYMCRWISSQIGGPPGSSTVLPSYVFMKCPYDFRKARSGKCPVFFSGEPENDCKQRTVPINIGPQPHKGNPTCVATGTKVEWETDYVTTDGLFDVTRMYRSKQHQDFKFSITEFPGFGPNWHGPIPGIMVVFGWDMEVVEYLSAEGGVDYFHAHDRFNRNGYSYYSPARSRRQFEAVTHPGVPRDAFFINQSANQASPGEFKLTEADGSYTLYRRGGNFSYPDGGRYLIPVTQVSPGGYTRSFIYPDDGLYPASVVDSFGRQFGLKWKDTPLLALAAQGAPQAYVQQQNWRVLEEITLPGGERLTYQYDDTTAVGRSGREDRLIKVIRANAAGQQIWIRELLYENQQYPYALTGKKDGNGARTTTYTYHDYGHVKSSERSGGYGKYEFEYSVYFPPNSYDIVKTYTAVKNPLGRREVYDHFRYFGYAAGNVPSTLTSITGDGDATVPSDSQSFSYAQVAWWTGVYTMTSSTDKKGISTHYGLDWEARRPVWIAEAVYTPFQRQTDLQWHPQLDLPTRIDVPGLRTETTYGSTGQVLSRTFTDTTTHSLPYATNGQSRTETYTWSPAGRLLSINGPRPVDTAGKDDIMAFADDTSGNLLTITDPLGFVTSFAGHDAHGRPASMTDANGVVTEFAYDPLGRLVQHKVKDPHGPASDALTLMEYDIEGRVTGLTLPQTAKLSMVYNLAGLLTDISAPNGESISFVHDMMGNITRQQVKRANGSASSTITRTFDTLGRMLSLTMGPGRTSSWAYDNNGNAVQQVSPLSQATTAAFDPLNRLVSTLASDTGTTATAYNPRDDVAAFTDPANVTTSFVRNGFGEVIRETSPDRGTSVYYYDVAGDVVAAIDGRGQRIDYVRDIAGRVLTATPQGLSGQAISYAYDTAALPGSYAVGRLSSVTAGNVDVRFAYDHRGNVTVKQQRIGGGTLLRLNLKYDLADRVSELTYPSGRIVSYAYDALGRVNAVQTRDSSATTAQTDLASNIAYDPFAALKSADLGSGLKLSVDWGNDQRLAARRVYRNIGSDVWHSSYAYDANDNITAITDLVNPSNSRSYGYDSMDRLARTDGVLGSYGREDYVHDRNGNRLALQRWVNASDATPADTESYALASGTNRLTSVTSALGTRSFTHDARGNLTGDTRSSGGPSVTVSYDGHARLVSYANGAGDAQVVAYNGLDERVQVTTTPADGAVDTRMVLYDLDHRIIGEYGAGGAGDLKTEYIWLLPQVGADSPFGGDDGTGGYMPLAIAIGAGGSTSQIAWAHGNHLGTPVLTTDATGTALAPYGHALIGFPGQWRPANAIAGAEFYYNRYRDYDPTLGRYIQADPIGLEGRCCPLMLMSTEIR